MHLSKVRHRDARVWVIKRITFTVKVPVIADILTTNLTVINRADNVERRHEDIAITCQDVCVYVCGYEC